MSSLDLDTVAREANSQSAQHEQARAESAEFLAPTVAIIESTLRGLGLNLGSPKIEFLHHTDNKVSVTIQTNLGVFDQIEVSDSRDLFTGDKTEDKISVRFGIDGPHGTIAYDPKIVENVITAVAVKAVSRGICLRTVSETTAANVEQADVAVPALSSVEQVGAPSRPWNRNIWALVKSLAGRRPS